MAWFCGSSSAKARPQTAGQAEYVEAIRTHDHGVGKKAAQRRSVEPEARASLDAAQVEGSLALRKALDSLLASSARLSLMSPSAGLASDVRSLRAEAAEAIAVARLASRAQRLVREYRGFAWSGESREELAVVEHRFDRAYAVWEAQVRARGEGAGAAPLANEGDIRAGSTAWRFYQFRDAVQQEARFLRGSNDDLHRRLLELAIIDDARQILDAARDEHGELMGEFRQDFLRQNGRGDLRQRGAGRDDRETDDEFADPPDPGHVHRASHEPPGANGEHRHTGGHGGRQYRGCAEVRQCHGEADEATDQWHPPQRSVEVAAIPIGPADRDSSEQGDRGTQAPHRRNPHSPNVATSVTQHAASLIRGTAARAPLASPSLMARSRIGGLPSLSSRSR